MKRLWFGLLAIVLIPAAACTTTVGGDCGPFPDTFKTTGFFTTVVQVDSIDSTGRPVLSDIDGDTLQKGQFAVQMEPKKDLYSMAARRQDVVSLIPAVRACSPPIPTSEEVIQDLRVYSTKAFRTDYSARDNLARLFDIVALYRAEFGYRRAELPDFLSGAPNAADELILILDAAPDTMARMQFTIEYEQRGPGLETYSYTTEPVVLAAP